MKRSIEDTSIVMIGAGNLATSLAKAFYKKGFRIMQVYSHTLEAAQKLAWTVEADATNIISDIVKNGQLYVVALKDSVVADLIPSFVVGREQALWVHTAGSLPMNLWNGLVEHYGVFYPLQTFSKQREMDFTGIPLFIEGHTPEDKELLKEVAQTLSKKVYEASSEQRESLHLAAVFTCNFTNYMYMLAARLLQERDLPFDVLLPLIDETAYKVHKLSPAEAQTGPAKRNDKNVINHHLNLLSNDVELQSIYRILSEKISKDTSLSQSK